MIATIRTPSRSSTGAGVFEAIKHGVEYDVYDDNHFDITIHNQTRADLIAKAANGKIVAVVDALPVY
jgi:hypothetical protein